MCLLEGLPPGVSGRTPLIMPTHACVHNSVKKTAVYVSEIPINHCEIYGQTTLEIDFFFNSTAVLIYLNVIYFDDLCCIWNFSQWFDHLCKR